MSTTITDTSVTSTTEGTQTTNGNSEIILTPMRWSEARLACLDRGAILAEPRSAQQMRDLWATVLDAQDYFEQPLWIGGISLDSQWTWDSDGTTIDPALDEVIVTSRQLALGGLSPRGLAICIRAGGRWDACKRDTTRASFVCSYPTYHSSSTTTVATTVSINDSGSSSRSSSTIYAAAIASITITLMLCGIAVVRMRGMWCFSKPMQPEFDEPDPTIRSANWRMRHRPSAFDGSPVSNTLIRIPSLQYSDVADGVSVPREYLSPVQGNGASTRSSSLESSAAAAKHGRVSREYLAALPDRFPGQVSTRHAWPSQNAMHVLPPNMDPLGYVRSSSSNDFNEPTDLLMSPMRKFSTSDSYDEPYPLATSVPLQELHSLHDRRKMASKTTGDLHKSSCRDGKLLDGLDPRPVTIYSSFADSEPSAVTLTPDQYDDHCVAHYADIPRRTSIAAPSDYAQAEVMYEYMDNQYDVSLVKEEQWGGC